MKLVGRRVYQLPVFATPILMAISLAVSACNSRADRCHFSDIDHLEGIFYVTGDGGTEYNTGDDCSLDIRFPSEDERSQVMAAYTQSKFKSVVRPIKLSVAGSHQNFKGKNNEDYEVFTVTRLLSIDANVDEADAKRAFKKAHGMDDLP